MIVAAIPISAIVLMYGGASIGDILRQQVVLLTMAVAFGAVGIFASALLRRTQAATVATYCAVLGLTLGSAMIFGFWTEIANANDTQFAFTRERAPEQLRYLNPMVAMLDIVADVEGTPTRFTAALYELFGQDLASGAITVDPGGFVPPDEPAAGGGFGTGSLTSGYWWPRVSLSLLGLAAILTLASTQLVVPAGMRGFRARRRRATFDATWPVQPEPASPAIEEIPDR
jgi:hypothetical protein